MAQKSVFRDQVFSAAEEIAHHALDGSIRGGLGPAFYALIGRLKTEYQPLFAFVPEVFQMHQQVTFRGNRAELTWIWSGDYTTHILKLSPDGHGSRDRLYCQNSNGINWVYPDAYPGISHTSDVASFAITGSAADGGSLFTVGSITLTVAEGDVVIEQYFQVDC